MAQLLRLSAEQVVRICPFFPKEWGGKRVNDRKVLCSIIHGTRSSLHWGDAPAAYDPHKTLYNCRRHCSDKGVFDLIFSELSASDSAEPPDAPEPEVLMLDATDIKAHPTACSLNKGGVPPAWWHQGGA